MREWAFSMGDGAWAVGPPKQLTSQDRCLLLFRKTLWQLRASLVTGAARCNGPRGCPRKLFRVAVGGEDKGWMKGSRRRRRAELAGKASRDGREGRGLWLAGGGVGVPVYQTLTHTAAQRRSSPYCVLRTVCRVLCRTLLLAHST